MLYTKGPLDVLVEPALPTRAGLKKKHVVCELSEQMTAWKVSIYLHFSVFCILDNLAAA
jgi:hypothetical protein